MDTALHSPTISTRIPSKSLKSTVFNKQKRWCRLNCHRSVLKCNDAISLMAKHGVAEKMKIGEKWKEYHGCQKWQGLLDPLDEKLRQEIVKFGEFVQATYSAMDFDPDSQTYGSCKHCEDSLLKEAGLGNYGYRVTRSINASSAIQVPSWAIDKWGHLLRKTSWVGFVALCEDEREIAKLGRRDIVVAYRGTVTPLEWVENLKTTMHSVGDYGDRRAKVQSGFWSRYKSQDENSSSAADQVTKEIRRLVDYYHGVRGEKVSVTVTGHSLGAALAVLTAHDVRRSINASVPVSAVTFGGSRVGNVWFAESVESVVNVLRVVNVQDVITKLPGVFLNESTLECNEVFRLALMPWAYCHVGTALRLDSKECPYLRSDADMSCCHDLEAYLHLVDGFLSSKCQFRSSAKRDILRLLINQKSNVLHHPSLTSRHPHIANSSTLCTLTFNTQQE